MSGGRYDHSLCWQCRQSDGSDRRAQTGRLESADYPQWPPLDHRAAGDLGSDTTAVLSLPTRWLLAAQTYCDRCEASLEKSARRDGGRSQTLLDLDSDPGRFRPLRSSRRALLAIFGIGPRSRKRFPFVAVGSISSIRQKHVISKSDCLHGVPPQKIGKSSEDSRLHESFPLQVLLPHRVR
jgi:hypothetical protein